MLQSNAILENRYCLITKKIPKYISSILYLKILHCTELYRFEDLILRLIFYLIYYFG